MRLQLGFVKHVYSLIALQFASVGVFNPTNIQFRIHALDHGQTDEKCSQNMQKPAVNVHVKVHACKPLRRDLPVHKFLIQL